MKSKKVKMEDCPIFMRRMWKIIPLESEELMENVLDASPVRGKIVPSDRPMPPRLTREEESLVRDGECAVLNPGGHKRFLREFARIRNHAQQTNVPAPYSHVDRLWALRSRVGDRIAELCEYALSYYESRMYFPDLDLSARRATFSLKGSLAHPDFNRKDAYVRVTIPLTPSGAPVPRIVETDHPNREKLEKLLFSKRNWMLVERGKVKKAEGMPAELTDEEEAYAHWWTLSGGKRGRYVAARRALEGRSEDESAGARWLGDKLRRRVRAVTGYYTTHYSKACEVVSVDVEDLSAGFRLGDYYFRARLIPGKRGVIIEDIGK